MKILSAVAVGVLLAASSGFGATILNETQFNNLCTAEGPCTAVSFSSQTVVNDNLFINTSGGASLIAASFSGGEPFVPNAGNPALNNGNGFMPNTSVAPGAFINIGADAGPLTAAGFIVNQSVMGDGQGLLFTLHFTGGGTQLLGVLDGNVGPTFLGFQVDGSETVSHIGITAATNILGTERFTLYNFNFLTGEIGGVVPPGEQGDVPEPATFGLMGAALLGLGIWHRTRKS